MSNENAENQESKLESRNLRASESIESETIGNKSQNKDLQAARARNENVFKSFSDGMPAINPLVLEDSMTGDVLYNAGHSIDKTDREASGTNKENNIRGLSADNFVSGNFASEQNRSDIVAHEQAHVMGHNKMADLEPNLEPNLNLDRNLDRNPVLKQDRNQIAEYKENDFKNLKLEAAPITEAEALANSIADILKENPQARDILLEKLGQEALLDSNKDGLIRIGNKWYHPDQLIASNFQDSSSIVSDGTYNNNEIRTSNTSDNASFGMAPPMKAHMDESARKAQPAQAGAPEMRYQPGKVFEVGTSLDVAGTAAKYDTNISNDPNVYTYDRPIPQYPKPQYASPQRLEGSTSRTNVTRANDRLTQQFLGGTGKVAFNGNYLEINIDPTKNLRIAANSPDGTPISANYVDEEELANHQVSLIEGKLVSIGANRYFHVETITTKGNIQFQALPNTLIPLSRRNVPQRRL